MVPYNGSIKPTYLNHSGKVGYVFFPHWPLVTPEPGSFVNEDQLIGIWPEDWITPETPAFGKTCVEQNMGS